MAEKRNIDRLRKRFSVRFGIDCPTRLAFTEDLSSTGLFIKTTNICVPGSLIQVEVNLSEQQTVVLEGRVMWAKKVPPQLIHIVKKCGMGVRIVRFLQGAEAYAKICVELAARGQTATVG
jgi:PilZ domain-containing protein